MDGPSAPALSEDQLFGGLTDYRLARNFWSRWRVPIFSQPQQLTTRIVASLVILIYEYSECYLAYARARDHLELFSALTFGQEVCTARHRENELSIHGTDIDGVYGESCSSTCTEILVSNSKLLVSSRERSAAVANQNRHRVATGRTSSSSVCKKRS